MDLQTHFEVNDMFTQRCLKPRSQYWVKNDHFCYIQISRGSKTSRMMNFAFSYWIGPTCLDAYTNEDNQITAMWSSRPVSR